MDLLGYILVLFLGIFFGIITGLIPGIHINLVSLLVLSYSSLLLSYFDLTQILIFIVSMSVTHTFIDFIPSLIFGVPSSDTALSVLPAHKMLLEGRAKLAIHLSALGSFYGILIAIMMMPIMFLFLEVSYLWIKNIVGYLLILILIFLILIEKNLRKKIWASIIVLFSVGIGFLILNSSIVNQQLFLIFTGLFGVSNLLYSLKDGPVSFPEQKNKEKNNISKKNLLLGLFSSGVGATLCSVFPGLGNAQAGVISTFFMKKNSTELMIIMFGAINTINFAVSFFTFYLIQRTRNGSIYVLAQILGFVSLNQIFLYLVVILIVGIIAYFLTILIGNSLLSFAIKNNITIINFIIIFLLYFLSYFFSGVWGLIVLHMCAMLGLLSLVLGISRYHLMGVLIGPVIFNLI